MDGRGRFLDNIFIERLWRSLKYECVFLHAFSGGRDARKEISGWIDFYNNRRPHAAQVARPEPVYIEINCRFPARAHARPSNRQSWRRDNAMEN